MELKIIYGNGKNVKLEATVANEEERKTAVKMIKMTLADLSEKEIDKSVEIYSKTTDNNNEIEYASEGQKAYMDKLGIEYNDKTTKIEAIDLINEWKVAHNIPISGKQK